MPGIRPSSLARAIECPASVWQVDDGLFPVDPNKYQAEADRGTEIHAWWESLTTDNPLPPPCPPKHQATWMQEAERIDPGGYAELHLVVWEYRGQPLATQDDKENEDPRPPKDGSSFVFRGSADRAGRGSDQRSPWVEDLKTGRARHSPRGWQLQAYGLGTWLLVERPPVGVMTSILYWFRSLKAVGEAKRHTARLSVGDLWTCWTTLLKLRERVARREPPTPNPECGLCPVALSCPALKAPF